MTGDITPGKRVFLDDGESWIDLQPGEYAVNPDDGQWHGATPLRRSAWPHHLVANLSKHTVVENEDGTITVAPSILVKTQENDCEVQWHGYLEKGVWREV